MLYTICFCDRPFYQLLAFGLGPFVCLVNTVFDLFALILIGTYASLIVVLFFVFMCNKWWRWRRYRALHAHCMLTCDNDTKFIDSYYSSTVKWNEWKNIYEHTAKDMPEYSPAIVVVSVIFNWSALLKVLCIPDIRIFQLGLFVTGTFNKSSKLAVHAMFYRFINLRTVHTV